MNVPVKITFDFKRSVGQGAGPDVALQPDVIQDIICFTDGVAEKIRYPVIIHARPFKHVYKQDRALFVSVHNEFGGDKGKVYQKGIDQPAFS